jgi:outer membrane protein assembly factor BamB
MLYVATGSQGENGRPLYAIRAGASGDISLAPNTTSNDFVAWFQPRFSGYTPSPLVYRGRVWVVNNNGVLQVADARTGVEIFKARVGGGGQTFSSSPLASDGRIYLLSEDGDTFVLRDGDKYDEIAKNSLGEMSFATPAPAPGTLFIRTQTKLYRIDK